MIEWLDEFYGDPELRSTLMQSFLPAFSGYVSEAVGGPVSASFVTSLAQAYVEHHLNSSRAQLQEVIAGSDEPLAALADRFSEWEQKRPTKVARNELVRAANAAQVQSMRERGVTRKVWRTSGSDTCPYCKGLNGKTIAVEESFFTPDDSYEPEGAERPLTFTSKIGHPPVHAGCDCSIEAVEETTTVALDEQRLSELANDATNNANGSQRTIDLAIKAGYSQEEAESLAIMSQGWNIDANSFDGWGLRYAAHRRGATLGDLPSRPLWKQFVDRGYAEQYAENADRLLDLSTAEVRRHLGETGTIRVYRGMTMGTPIDGIPTDGTVVTAAIEQRPLASWSLSKDEATKFASTSANEYGGMAYVLEMDVPVTDVAGLAGTGLGNGAHGEVVLFGRPEHAARVFVPQD